MNKKKKRKAPRTIIVYLNLLFHFYRKHKNELTALRTWFVARHILDKRGRGWVRTDSLCRVAGINYKNLKRAFGFSNLFRGINRHRVYYISRKKITRTHKLKTAGSKIRGEKLTQVFIRQYKKQKTFVGYITKCYVENDLNPRHKRRYTHGRIGTWNIAEYFKIAKNTVLSNLRASTAKSFPNRIHYPMFRFRSKKEFGRWLLRDMDTKVGQYVVGNNLNSYRPFMQKNGSYTLIQILPHIYKFTGVFLAGVRKKRGNRGRKV